MIWCFSDARLAALRPEQRTGGMTHPGPCRIRSARRLQRNGSAALCAVGAISCASFGQLFTNLITFPPTDINQDGVVGASDLAELIGEWGTAGSGGTDLDGDGVVTSQDLAQLIGTWGQEITPLAMLAGDARGVGWADVDNDGLDDLYISVWTGGPNRLLMNHGDTEFSAVDALPVGDEGFGGGVAFADYDNDGDLDLFLCNSGMNALMRNDGAGVFVDVTSGDLVRNYLSRGAAWGDYDLDGDVDLYVANYNGSDNESHLYRNDGGDVFTSVSEGTVLADTSIGRSPCWGDYDNDGDPDLLLVDGNNGEGPGPATNGVQVFRNDNGVFMDVSSIEMSFVFIGRGAAWGDYDNDGDLDFYVGQVTGENHLFRNDGNDTFTDVTNGFPLNWTAATRSISWVDYDNDGDLDLYLATLGSNRMFRNDGVDEGGLPLFSIVEDPVLKDSGNATGAAWSDFDRDGDLDVMIANKDRNSLLRNDIENGNHWLHLDLIGVQSNRSGIGARVRVVTDLGAQIREVYAGSGYMAMDSLTVEFGLGEAEVVELIEIRWPSGVSQSFVDIDANQRLTITEKEGLRIPSPDRSEMGDIE